MAGPNGGRRPGSGRKRGPSKATIEKAVVAERVLGEVVMQGRKLGKETLEEYMVLFAGLSSRFQPEGTDPASVRAWAKTEHEPMFEKYVTLAVSAAKELAKYQSPTFKAIMNAPPPTVNDGRKQTKFTLNIFAEISRAIEGESIASRARVINSRPN